MNQLLDSQCLEHTVARREYMEATSIILEVHFLEPCAIALGDDAVVFAENDVHLTIPGFRSLGDCCMARPTKPVGPPTAPHHHSHGVINDVEGAKTVKVV